MLQIKTIESGTFSLLIDLMEIIDWHKQKFPNQMLAISIPHALTYFVDADESEDPHCLNGYTWEEIKIAIKKVVRDFLS